MTEPTIHSYCIVGLLGCGLCAFLALLFINAPYGRHTRKGWGVEVPSRVGWIVPK